MLLHICCAPCSTHVIDALKADYDLDGYFYNPNIHPKNEYKLREKEIQRYAESNNIMLIHEEYDDVQWFELTKGMDDMTEGDKRCEISRREGGKTLPARPPAAGCRSPCPIRAPVTLP